VQYPKQGLDHDSIPCKQIAKYRKVIISHLVLAGSLTVQIHVGNVRLNSVCSPSKEYTIIIGTFQSHQFFASLRKMVLNITQY